MSACNLSLRPSKTSPLLIMFYHYYTLAVAAFVPVSFAASTFSPARPPAIPLAVKSPYVNCWQQAGSDAEMGGPGNGGYLAG